MNHEDLFEAIGTADESMLEASERNRNHGYKAMFAAVAACLALAITLGVLLRPASTQHLIAPDKITWSIDSDALILKDSGVSGIYPDTVGFEYQFVWDISIEAKVLEVLPDTYSIPGASTGDSKYRILRLRVLDEIIGSGLPKEIYYRLPETLDPELTEYDSLILNMKQIGIEHYQMRNENKNQIEAFSFLFGQAEYAPDYGAVMAFKDGKLDLSLWEKDGWNESQKWAQRATADPEGNYPGRVDRSAKDTKRAIIEQAEQFKRDGQYTFHTKLLTMDDFDWQEAEEILEYVKPFENGTFRQALSIDASTDGEYRGTTLYYERTINGFSTNDVVSIYQSFNGNHREVCRIGPQFTEDDLQNLPDLVSVINNLDAYLPETYKGEDISEHFCGVTGHYAKVDDQIYGVVTIAWGNPKWEEPKGPTCIVGMRVYEYTRILVLQDGTKRIVTEEELKSCIG